MARLPFRADHVGSLLRRMEEFWSDLSAAYADEVDRLAKLSCARSLRAAR